MELLIVVESLFVLTIYFFKVVKNTKKNPKTSILILFL